MRRSKPQKKAATESEAKPARNARRREPVPYDFEVGIIKQDRFYLREAFMRVLGLSESAMRVLVRRGLPMRKMGKQKGVMGHEFLKFAEKNFESVASRKARAED